MYNKSGNKLTSLKTKLLIPMIAIIAVAILIVSFVMYRQSSKLVEGNAVSVLHSNLSTASIIISDWNAKVMSTLESVAENEVLKQAIRDNDLALAEEVLANYYYSSFGIEDKDLFANVCLVNTNGIVIVTGKEMEGVGLNTYNVGYGENVDRALKKETHKSVVTPSPVNGKMEMWCSAPIIDNGKVVAVAALPAYIETMEYFLEAANASEANGINLFLTDSMDTIIASTEHEILGMKASDIYDFDKYVDEQLIQSEGFDGRDVLVMFDSVDLMGWKAYASMDNVLIMNTQINMTLLTALIVIMLASVVLYYIISKLTKPIKVLNEISEKIGKGITNVNIPVDTNDELGQLAMSFREVQNNISLIVTGFERISQSIMNGNITDRGDDTAVPGDFSEIVKGVNSIIDNMTGYLNNLSTPLAIISKEQRISFVNSAGLAINNQTLNDVIDKDFIETFPDNNNKERKEGFQKVLESGQKYSIPVSATNAQGVTTYMDYTCMPNKNYKGEIVGFMSINNDVSETILAQKKAEKTTIYQENEVNELITKLEQLADGRFDFSYVAAKGDNDVENAYKNFEKISSSLTKSTQTIKSYIDEMTVKLSEIAGNNFDVSITREYIGDFVSIKDSIELIADNMDAVISEIQDVSKQVEMGASQVAEANQNLMLAFATQSDTVNKLKEAVAKIAEQTQKNVQNAQNANGLSNDAQNAAENGNTQMKEMTNAMEEIKQASNNIAKIIKVIEDIAFQTNLLALNASVESARAGQHGKGFAVVATEVGNLAKRSQKAAQESTEMIAASLDRVNAGTQIATKTSEALNKIVETITDTVSVMNEIVVDSDRQAEEIKRIQQGVEEIYNITGNNTAIVENGVSTSEELAGQASVLEELIQQFNLKKR